VKAVVLVGGEGTRLRPLTLTTPKQMLPVAGRPMIERVLEHLARHGVDAAVLSLGYRPDAFMKAYPDGLCAGVKLIYAVEPEPLDTAGAIRFAAHHAGLTETFVVVNGDVLTELDVSALVRLHHETGAEATIALTPVADPSAFGVVPTDETGRVVAFIEKPAPGEAPTNLINAGTYVLEPVVLDRIPAGRRVSIEREIFPALVADGALYAMASDAQWIDAGTPADFIAASLAYGPPGGSNGAVANGVLGVVANSVLGANVSVADGARIEGSVIFDDVVIGAAAVVSDSIVGRGATVEPGASVTDLSVIGEGAVVTAGAQLSATRLAFAP
jgi:mannose-1-phosphate guanylyltransferase